MNIPRPHILPLLAAVLVALAGCTADQPRTVSSAPAEAELFVPLAAGVLDYYPPGEYVKAGVPVTPPKARFVLDGGVAMMKQQVSQADYARCVADGACKPLAREHAQDADPNRPVVGVSWRDATDYAAWFSRVTGQNYRLPRYEEWVYAAGAAYKEDVILGALDEANPAARWLAEYDLESQRKTTVQAAVQPFGSFGRNEKGFLDMAGNVWDWTDTCMKRVALDAEGQPVAGGNENCGIRVVAGPHRSYITDFIRDPKGGACSVGVPPSNLGIRLVRDASSGGLAQGPERSLKALLRIGGAGQGA